MEQVTGLEPVISAWKANVLPLHYTCLFGYIARDWLNPEMLIWSGRRGSNPPPQPWQGCALPNELLPQKMPLATAAENLGTPSGIRTLDTLIKSQVL